MRLFIFITLLLLHNRLTALSLKDKMSHGSPGDFIITEAQNRSCSLIRLHSVTPTAVTIEEISFPEKHLPKNLEIWINSGAQGHTSWTLATIDLRQNVLKSAFSFTKGAWLDTSRENSFFLNILDLTLSPVPHEERRRIGPPPTEGSDTRKIWIPPLVVHGKKVSSPKFSVYRCIHPKDGSPLSGKRIELFFNQDNESFPFPIWGQVTDSSDAALKFRIIDSGQNLSSPKKYPL